ncbi:MAG TPA: acyl carrier protein [Thermoclostridium sp.]|jgi:D-alanine--poly(phosphoribitol) ligase subunit 2|nr:acyl carrier protein [Clostridiaceae bacterium]HZK26345.1 acyl carrier protein [Thermoclostridium sp.]
MESLIEILEELHPEVDFEEHKSLIDDKVLDSFDIITLISEIHEEYDVRVPVDEIIPENFNSAQSLYSLIQRLQDEG